MLRKGNFTRDEWNHLLCSQKDAGEERVTAKSKPMMNLVSRYSVRDPNVLASTASESPRKTRYESQISLSSWNEQQPRTVRLVMGANSSNYSEWNIDDKWSSQEWKSGEMLGSKNGETVDDKLVVDIDVDSDTAAESDLSLKSRSFLNGVNDRLRKMLTRSTEDSLQDIDKRSMIGWMFFMSSTLEASAFMVKNYSENLHSVKNTGKDLTLKQMFDISEKLITEQSGEIFGVTPINWEDSSWKHVSLVKMKKSSVSSMQRFMYFQILCYVLERWTRTHNQILSGKTSWCGSKVHHNTELSTQLTVSRWNSSGIFSQDSPHCSSTTKSKSSWTKWATQHKCIANVTLVSLFAKKFPAGRWSFLGPGSEKKWYSIYIDTPRGEWDRVAELMMIKFGESGHPVFRATIPLSRGTLKSKGGGKLSIHLCADGETIETVFSHNNFCYSAQYLRSSLRFVWRIQILPSKNGETCAGRTIWPIVCANKFVDDNTYTFDQDPAQEDLLQKYKERVERLSQQNRVIKFCIDAAFLTTV